MARKKKSRGVKKSLFGLGFDNKDGHTRVTKGENFYLYGGSKETHGEMQEKAIKINEQLKKKRKTMDTVTRQEFAEIAHKAGLRPLDEKKKSKHD
jgi:hypothetical protein